MILPPPTFPNSLPSAMFQKNSAEQTRIYGGVHRKVSSDLNQATGCRVGADLEKKILKQHSSTMDFQFKRTPFRNYMKPTRSSDAKRGKLRATVNSPTSSSPAASAKKFSKVPSCVKKSVNRATCSSTLKDYKFPAALVNNSEGKSKMRVCPYTYCSLNGHIHEMSSSSSSLPIKCFISEKRRILKNLRSVDKTLFLDKIGEEEEKVGEEGVNDVIAEIPSDLFAEIYTMSREEMVGEKNCGEINIQGETDEKQGDRVFDENQCSYVLDQTSECSGDELNDVTENLLEYVEVDDEKKAREDYEFEENGEDTKNSGIESMDSDCDAEDDSEEEEPETEHSDGVSDENISPETSSLQQTEDKSATIEAINETIESMLNASSIDLSSKWNITRKMRAEEFEQVIEFNPKPPNFLPLEPDPEAEKVDLRHQMMDGRRNAEEWMIDYALQNTLTRLGDSAWKKKVALLVEAFETVAPSHTCETPVSHGSSSFMNLCFIQT